MKINVSVKGIDKVMNDFSLKGVKAQSNVDKVAEKYTRKMANESAGMAPVDTGDLRSNLLASPRRIKLGTWEWGGTLAYTRRQEYENPTRKGFIRKATWNNRQAFRDEIRREVTKK